MTTNTDTLPEEETAARTALADQVRRVQAAREAAGQTFNELNGLRQTFEATHAELIATADVLRRQVAEEEARLRDYAVQEYRLSGAKHPTAGVTIRETTAVQYDAMLSTSVKPSHEAANAPPPVSVPNNPTTIERAKRMESPWPPGMGRR